MANTITRSFTFANGGVADGGQVDTEIANCVNAINNADAGTNRWTVADATTLKYAGQDIAQWVRYRRPVLQYSSATVVNIETGLTGTSGQAAILFPDGSYRTDSTAGRINCNLAQNAVLSGSAQSGLRTGSAADATWYSFYAVKVTDSSTNFVHVADTVIPSQGNYSTLNSNFGTNGWVYLGCLPYGNNVTSNAIPTFIMCGNKVVYRNTLTSTVSSTVVRGLRVASTAGATTLTYTYGAGTNMGTGQTPAQLSHGSFTIISAASTTMTITDSGTSINYIIQTFSSGINLWNLFDMPLTLGLKSAPGASLAQEIDMTSHTDSVLGVGPNPLL